MNTASITRIHTQFINQYHILLNQKELENQIQAYYTEEELSLANFISTLFETGALAHLSYFRNWVTKNDLQAHIESANFPVLLFEKNESGYGAFILTKQKGTVLKYVIKPDIWQGEKFDAREPDRLIRGQDFSDLEHEADKILMITCFPIDIPYTGDPENEAVNSGEKLHTLHRFYRLLRSEKREIGYIYIYAIISGIIGLSLPLGIQSIIGFISSGQVSSSVIVLIVFIILGIVITGSLQVMQLSLVEHIQQRIFTKTAFEFAFRIPKIKLEHIFNYYPPELVNRFFDVITLQKGFAKILLESSAALLQILFGLILLSLYHSAFIFFGIFLVLILVFILRFTGPKGLQTSLNESRHKYKVANWLEELAKSLSTFKLAGNSFLPMEKTDHSVSNYLHARKSHFKVLVKQYMSFVAFKTLITGGLLIMGCILLVEKQINIGQFVASEIIIILIMSAIEKIIIHLDTVYDVLTSLEKIGKVTDLPIDTPKGMPFQDVIGSGGISLSIKNLRYKFPDDPVDVLKGINLEIKSSERICISGYSNSGKTTLIRIVSGLLDSYEGIVAYNNLSLRGINRGSFHALVGVNFSKGEIFNGTLLENITLGRSGLKLEDALWAIDSVGLTDFLQQQPEGIYTHLINEKLGLSESVARKIIIARSIVSRPKLLILEDFYLGLEKSDTNKLLDLLSGKEHQWTLVVVSNNAGIMKICDRTIILKDGMIVRAGVFEEIREDIHFKSLA